MKKHVKKLIEQAIDQCGANMHDVRKHLSMALVEIQKEELKVEKNKSPARQWTLNLQTGTLQNLNWEQTKKAMRRIDGMIADESKSLKPKESPGEFLLE